MTSWTLASKPSLLFVDSKRPTLNWQHLPVVVNPVILTNVISKLLVEDGVDLHQSGYVMSLQVPVISILS